MENNFGKGNEDTGKMISKWNAAGTEEGFIDAPQEKTDIWKHIQTIYDNGNGWFLPSRGEWAAFMNELGITETNYDSTYELSSFYWTSSQSFHNKCALAVYIPNGAINSWHGTSTAFFVRLATTF